METNKQLKMLFRQSIDNITRKSYKSKGGKYEPETLDLMTELIIVEISLCSARQISIKWTNFSMITSISAFIINFMNIIVVFLGNSHLLLTIIICAATIFCLRYTSKGLLEALDYEKDLLQTSTDMFKKIDFNKRLNSMGTESKNRDNYLLMGAFLIDDITKRKKEALDFVENFKIKENE